MYVLTTDTANSRYSDHDNASAYQYLNTINLLISIYVSVRNVMFQLEIATPAYSKSQMYVLFCYFA